jgi:hypothetical protein
LRTPRRASAGSSRPTEDLERRVARLERALSRLLGVRPEEMEENPADDPVVEERQYEASVLRVHRSGKTEFLRKCPYCAAPVGDLPTHKANCPKRPVY